MDENTSIKIAPAMIDVVVAERPINRLARALYEEMEHLDPGVGDYVEWDALSEREHQFYLLCVKAVIMEALAYVACKNPRS
jgi:hypothetical protein